MVENFKSKFVVKIALCCFIIIVTSCAKQASPTGGPKDEKAPIPIKSKPINYSTNFTGNKITILFDEYVVLKNANQEVLVSPPLKEKPKIKLRGKNIVLKIRDTLKENTTYGINFHNSITDLNEGNVLENFSFEFATGDKFDSLYIGGTLKNAFNLKSEEKLYVMLYSNLNDSTPRTQLPEHISKTDKDGNFLIANIKPKPYHIFALKDLNNNMLFDLPSESIAFSDSTFNPEFKESEFTDTLVFIDSISPNLKDTIFHDSIITHKEFVTTIGDINLFMFQEDFQQQYFKKEYRFERQQVAFAFNRELADSFSVFPIIDSQIVASNWYIQETQTTKDSMVYWIKDSTMFNNDSLFFQINYTMKDSNNINYTKTDTLLLYFKDKNKPKKSKKDKKRISLGNIINKEKEEKTDSTPPPSPLKFTTNAESTLDLNKNIFLISRFPISKLNTDSISFIKIEKDTIETPVEYTLLPDSLFIRKININFEKDEKEKFKLTIPAGSFADIYGNINDTLTYEFQVQELKHYGTIKLEFINVKENSIVQLLDVKENLIKEIDIKGDTILNYEYLQPQKYIFKLFYDKNGNKKWDTGNFKEKKQPEQVFYFPTEIEVVSNFDYDYKWDLYPIPTEDNNSQNDTINILSE